MSKTVIWRFHSVKSKVKVMWTQQVDLRQPSSLTLYQMTFGLIQIVADDKGNIAHLMKFALDRLEKFMGKREKNHGSLFVFSHSFFKNLLQGH